MSPEADREDGSLKMHDSLPHNEPPVEPRWHALSAD